MTSGLDLPVRVKDTDWRYSPQQPVALGCAGCFLRAVCGGLQVAGGAVDCKRFCCRQSNCELVCFNSPLQYAKRLREIGGFGFENVPRADAVPFEKLRGFAPLIHHAYRRTSVFQAEVVAISLYELLDRNGAPKYRSRDEICKNFRIAPSCNLVLSGVHEDRFLERVWSSPYRREMLAFLRDTQLAMLTPPNFSTYTTVPRPENLYNMKRAVLLSEVFMAAGIPTALHINAIHPHDYDRYAGFLRDRPEFAAVSFEFITGAAAPTQMRWHVTQLTELAGSVGRPLQLIMRGGINALGRLSLAFGDILIIDSDPLMKALHRRELIFGNAGERRVVKRPLEEGKPVDGLLESNVRAAQMEASFARRNPHYFRVRALEDDQSGRAPNTSHEASQLDLLSYPGLQKGGTTTLNSEGMIAASESERTA